MRPRTRRRGIRPLCSPSQVQPCLGQAEVGQRCEQFASLIGKPPHQRVACFVEPELGDDQLHGAGHGLVAQRQRRVAPSCSSSPGSTHLRSTDARRGSRSRRLPLPLLAYPADHVFRGDRWQLGAQRVHARGGVPAPGNGRPLADRPELTARLRAPRGSCSMTAPRVPRSPSTSSSYGSRTPVSAPASTARRPPPLSSSQVLGRRPPGGPEPARPPAWAAPARRVRTSRCVAQVFLLVVPRPSKGTGRLW